MQAKNTVEEMISFKSEPNKHNVYIIKRLYFYNSLNFPPFFKTTNLLHSKPNVEGTKINST